MLWIDTRGMDARGFEGIRILGTRTFIPVGGRSQLPVSFHSGSRGPVICEGGTLRAVLRGAKGEESSYSKSSGSLNSR